MLRASIGEFLKSWSLFFLPYFAIFLAFRLGRTIISIGPVEATNHERPRI
jgi:hypothetical protein